eukprot:2207332-Rhodomonas_salina.1
MNSDKHPASNLPAFLLALVFTSCAVSPPTPGATLNFLVNFESRAFATRFSMFFCMCFLVSFDVSLRGRIPSPDAEDFRSVGKTGRLCRRPSRWSFDSNSPLDCAILPPRPALTATPFRSCTFQ